MQAHQSISEALRGEFQVVDWLRNIGGTWIIGGCRGPSSSSS